MRYPVIEKPSHDVTVQPIRLPGIPIASEALRAVSDMAEYLADFLDGLRPAEFYEKMDEIYETLRAADIAVAEAANRMSLTPKYKRLTKAKR